MLQRNMTGSARVFPTLDPPVTVELYEVFDHPVLLPGFVPVEEEEVEEPVESKGPRQRKEKS